MERATDGYPGTPFRVPFRDGSLAVLELGAGEPVMLVHGLGGDLSDFEYLLPSLAGCGLRAIGLDLPGFGKSVEETERPSIPLFVEAVGAVIDALGLEKVHLVGTSMGGQVALRFALARPDAVRSLVIADTGGTFEAMDGQRELALRINREAVILGRTDEQMADSMRRMFHGDGERFARTRDRKIQVLRSPDAPAIARSIARSVESIYESLLTPEELATIRAPALVLWGAQDRIIGPDEGRRLASHLAGSRLEILGDCGHMPWIEKVEEMTERIVGFLREAP